MAQDRVFTGQPILTQLLSFIPRKIISDLSKKYGSDRYCKSFYTWDHLVSMLYCSFCRCSSTRELITGVQANYGKLNHLGMQSVPRRSTLCDANLRRPEALFSELYHQLLKRYYLPVLPDSPKAKKDIFSKLFILDSTTISLFTDVMKGMGTAPANGKKKGGMKAHVLVKAENDLPCFVVLSPASSNDKIIYKYMGLPKGAIIVFDKGYGSFRQFDRWDSQGITWVSRFNTPWLYQKVSGKKISKQGSADGVMSDETVTLGDPNNNKTLKIKARRICFFDKEKDRVFVFVTNNFKMAASKIAAIYKRRWQIELLFKRLKTHYPLRYFLGESENAIKIQMWCALICDLLIKTVKDKIKRKWSFANIASMIRLHLMTYINLFKFLNNPDSALNFSIKTNPNGQLQLFKGG
jgi:hypothetical protein